MNSCIYYAQELLAILEPKKKPDSKMSEPAALAAVCQACDEVRKLEYLRSLNTPEQGDIIPNEWITSFTGDNAVDILKDDCGKFYSVLPASVIALTNDKGIRRVWRECDPENLIMPVLSGFKGMYNTSQIKNLGGRFGYFPRGRRIYYLQEMNLSEKVEMDLFASAASLDEDAAFPADESIINQIMQRAIEIWSVQKQIPVEPVSQSTSA